ncbi:hypothetical protein [Synechococcus sp. PROS-U-1]|uniref:tetratricopeptide repeat protein n=1 Tax=Synechococcus sp. PROS-U-1 TaxID=1400866 RepID=UPI0016462332|nr:hypothetical protein [Synechococcus sp. PROS-U-1]QNJ02038.1 tetratricopeptide repeat family protein [Synechococcus sp. PROS-U-1]
MSHPNKAELLEKELRVNNLQGCIEILTTATQDDQRDLQFLTRANDVQRALKDHKQALKYAAALLKEHPNKPVGYIRASQENLALGFKIDAKKNIEDGLNLFPDHPGILTAANQVFRSLEDFNLALVHAQSLCDKQPANPIGFIRAAQDHLKLDQPAEALNTALNGLTHHPDHPQLLTTGIDAARASNQIRQSLLFAQHLIHSSPDNPVGFIRAAQDHLKLDQYAEALNTVQNGLTHHPENPKILTTGIHAARASEQTEVALNFARELIRAEPNNPIGYINASQDLVELGHLDQSLQLMEELKRQRAGDQKYLESIRRFYRFIGDRRKSLEISEILFETSTETPVALISDLIALQQTQKALTMAQDHHLISSTEASELLNALEQAQTQPAINKTIQTGINTLEIFPHFTSDRFNPERLEQVDSAEIATICVIHVGKCAGESVLDSLRKSFPKESTCIIEYHVFDANIILKNIINKFADHENIHWIILNRDPIKRWISAFNWDQHLYHLNQYFYCHKLASKHLARYKSCLELARGISERHNEALQLSRFHHLAFGHMAMGQAWYLTEDLINKMSPTRTSLICTEQIGIDFELSIKKITSQFSFLKASKAKIVHTKNMYQRRYKSNTFKIPSDFSAKEAANLREHLSSDYNIQASLKERFNS